MMAINGSFGEDSGGFSFSNSYTRKGMEARVSRWDGMQEHLRPIVQRLRHVRIEKKDALSLFDEFKNRPGTLVYCDPPYLGKRIRGYDHDQNTIEFHETLLAKAVKAKCMVSISGYQNEFYDRYLITEHNWTKQIIKAVTKGNNGKSFERQEVIWFNRPYGKSKERGGVQLRLTKEEASNKKVNPER